MIRYTTFNPCPAAMKSFDHRRQKGTSQQQQNYDCHKEFNQSVTLNPGVHESETYPRMESPDVVLASN
jgi:hypothetical protein